MTGPPSNLPPGVTDRMIEDHFGIDACPECGEDWDPDEICENCGFTAPEVEDYDDDDGADWEERHRITDCDIARGIAPDSRTQDLWDHGYDSRYA